MFHLRVAGIVLAGTAVLVGLAAVVWVNRPVVPIVADDLGCVAVQGAQIDGVTVAQICADSGFRPSSDGFAFANWGGVRRGESVTTQTMVTLFGAEHVCSNPEQESCTPTPAALQWAAQFSELLANGRCEGMSVAAERFFSGLAQVASVDPDASAVPDLARGNPAVISDITYWWATQLVPEVAGAAARSRQLEPSRIVVDVIDGLRAGASNTLGIYSDSGAHALTPFAVTFDDPMFSIWVYDSNSPGRAGRVIVDVNTEEWRYLADPMVDDAKSSGWHGRGPGGLEYTPMEVRLKDFSAPFSDDRRENGFETSIFASSPDSSTEVNLLIDTPRIRVDSLEGATASDGVIVQSIDDDGVGQAVVAYLREDEPLTLRANVNESGVPLRISLDGPGMPWQQLYVAKAPRGPLPVTITRHQGGAVTYAVAAGAEAEVRFLAPPGSSEPVATVQLVGPTEFEVPGLR